MTQDESLSTLVLDVLRRVAPDMGGIGLDPDKTFRDQLGIDSIDFLNFVIGLEERLDMRIAESDYPKLSSLGGCLAYLESRLPAAARTATLPSELDKTSR
jgi:acyl carrier protein